MLREGATLPAASRLGVWIAGSLGLAILPQFHIQFNHVGQIFLGANRNVVGKIMLMGLCQADIATKFSSRRTLRIKGENMSRGKIVFIAK